MPELYYCVKCKKKTEMNNGKPALKGRCAECGTAVNAILATGKSDREEQTHVLLKDLRAFIKHDVPPLDTVREDLFKRVAEIIGED